MANIDLELSENINKALANGVMDSCRDFYHLAFFLTRDTEAAVRNVKDCVSAGLFNARKIQQIPTIKTWFYQELIALCLKRGSSSEAHVPQAYNTPSFRKLSELDAETKAVFALYYFEELSRERVAKVMRMKPAQVAGKLSYAAKELGMAKKNASKEAVLFEELTSAYKSPRIPNDYRSELQEVIERERLQNQKYFTKDKRSRGIRVVLGVIILAMLAYLIFTGGIDNIFR